MILTAHQPVYIPWLGLFQKIQSADLFCFFDIVQYQKKDFNNRNKIKTMNGEMWLSVPVETKGFLDKKINKSSKNIEIKNNLYVLRTIHSIYNCLLRKNKNLITVKNKQSKLGIK